MIRLIINDSKINEIYKQTCAEEISDKIDPINDNKFEIPNWFDSIREIFLYINLPKLYNDLYWNNNLLLDLIDKINIKLIDKFGYQFFDIILDKIYLKDLINNKLKNYSDKLLLRNLSIEERKKISQNEFTLILPLKISNFIKNPKEIISLIYRTKLEFEINTKNLTNELNSDNYFIESYLKVMGVYYDTIPRQQIYQDYDSGKTNQIFIINPHESI